MPWQPDNFDYLSGALGIMQNPGGIYDQLKQGGVTLTASVLRSATAVKTKVNGQIKILAIVNGRATISL